ncbi:hypothetical protein DMA11_18405 [Marinilabiliaceae bacterium JC017]|nr:hypothetical protein DMA11_18405 [Marinilabiliaceae bacterium JC017]
MKFLFFCIGILLLISCQDGNTGKSIKFKEDRNVSVNFESKIVDIDIKQILGFGNFCIVDSFFVFNDFKTNIGNVIHLFNKNNFQYYRSCGALGKGPGEITRLGASNVNLDHSGFWVQDYGKQVSWLFPLDSIVKNNNFLPTVKIPFSNDLFMDKMEIINNVTALGLAVKPLSVSSAEMRFAKLDLTTNKVSEYGYEHEGINKKRTYSSFCVDKKNGRFIRVYNRVDLITVCDFNGDLICNIYGPNWGVEKTIRQKYYDGVQSYKGGFIASYLGGNAKDMSEEYGLRVNYPSKLLIFNSNGHYTKTIVVGQQFSSFVVDEENGRVVMFFENRENPFGYIMLES